MAGPSIAKAEVTVDLDGKKIPAEAKALGEEAGRAMGEAHSEAFSDAVEKGYDEARDEQVEQLRKSGELGGDGSGKAFTEAFQNAVKRDAASMNRELVDIFKDADFGIDAFHDSLAKSGDDLKDIEGTVSRIDDLLLEAGDRGFLNEEQITTLSDRTHEWGDNMKDAVGQYRDLQGIRLEGVLDDLEQATRRSEDAAGEAQLMRDAFHDVNEERLNHVLDDIARARDETERYRGELGNVSDDLDELRFNHLKGLSEELGRVFEDQGNLHGYRAGVTNLGGAFDSIHRTILDANGAINDYERHMGGATEVSKKFRGETEAFAKSLSRDALTGLKTAASDVDKLGRSMDDGNRKTGGLTGAIGKLLRATQQFDPGDNMGQLFLIILSFAGPLAGLVSALGAQLVILGTAAAGAAVGAGLLVAASIGLRGAFGPISAPAAAAAKALKGLLDPLKELGRQATNATFGGLAKPFEQLRDVLPKLGPGVTAIGKALNSFLGGLTGAITKNIGPINKLLEGFAPIVRDMGGALTNLTGVFGGLFKAAMPFAQQFTSDLSKTIGKWSDWINSIKGQKALQKWFSDAQPVLSDLGGVLKAAGKAFSNLVTPQTLSDLHSLLGNISSLLGSLSDIGGALSPVAALLGDALQDVVKFLSSLSPFVEGFGVLADGIVKFFQPAVDFLSNIIKVGLTPLGAALTGIGKVFQALAPEAQAMFDGASKAIAPALKAVQDYAKAIGDGISQAIKIAQPALKAIGGSFTAAGDALGELISGFIGAGKQSETFKGATKTVSDFLNGPFKGAVGGVKRFFDQVTDTIKNGLIPAIKEIDWSKVTKGIDDLSGVFGPIIDAIGQVIGAFGSSISAVGAWSGAIQSAAKFVITQMTGVGTVVNDVLHGDFAAAAADSVTALSKTASAGADLKTKLSDAMSKTKKAIDDTNTAQQHLRDDGTKVTTKLSQAYADFSAAGAGNLASLATKMGLTGDKATAFRGVVQEAAKKAGVSLSDLASAKSLPDLENRLGLTGTAARTKFEAAIQQASGGAGTAIDKLPPKVQAVIGKMLQLDGQKANPHIGVTGDTAAISAVDQVRNKLIALNGSSATVSIISRQVGQGTAAVGGIMAGGQLIAGGRYAFSAGGVVTSPYSFGNVLTGESGAEAIVPLSRPLSQVDPSVRNLAAYAQGQVTTTHQGAYVAPGAIVVQTPAQDPAVVAQQTIDRLVPIL